MCVMVWSDLSRKWENEEEIMITESCIVLRVLTSRKGSDVWDYCGLFWDVPNNLPLSTLGLHSPSRGIQGHPSVKQSMAVLDIRKPVSYMCPAWLTTSLLQVIFTAPSHYSCCSVCVCVCVCGNAVILQR